MLTTTESQLKIARIVLELITPLSIGSGEDDPLYDTPLIRDGNGLPTIPATSLAGVLRRLVKLAPWGQASDESFLFGDSDTPSRLRLTFGHIHNAQNKAVDRLQPASTLHTDPILGPLLTQQPAVRERNRLNHQGVVDERGKFDRNITPAGHRFSCQFTLAYCKADQEKANTAWNALQQAMQSPILRLGGATRSGLGAVKLHQWREVSLDLTQRSDHQRFIQINRDLSQPLPDFFKKSPGMSIASPQNWDIRTFTLSPLTHWRTGHGGQSLKNDVRGKAPDLLPLTETIVCWDGAQQGSLQYRVVFPGSSIKGALRHRTEFHYRCQRLGETVRDGEIEQALELLFGNKKDGEEGRAGRLTINDCYLNLPTLDKVANLTHNSIDRYTQGGRDGALFTEQRLQEMLAIQLVIAPIHATADAATRQQATAVEQSFAQALDDLQQGRLALGAASGRGDGYFQLDTTP